MRLASLALSLFLAAFAATAQQTLSDSASQPIQRDPVAVQVLQNAVAVLGGQSVLGSLQNVVTQGTISPAKDIDFLEPGQFKWEYDLTGASYEFRTELQTGGATKVYASGHGNPAFGNGEKTTALASHTAYSNPPYHLPGVVLLRQLADKNYSIQLVESTAGRIHVRTSSAATLLQRALSPQDWYFDSTSGIPLRVEYRIPNTNDATDYRITATDFSDYKAVSGIAMPLTLVTSEGDTVLCTATVTSVLLNASVSTSDFDLAIGGAQ